MDVSFKQKLRLESAIAAVRTRWGPHALRTLRSEATSAQAPPIPTGFPALDQTLGIGGIPRGRITEILGCPTSGMATLALKISANGQAGGDVAVYVDLERTLDPDYAAHCGVDLDRLLVVRPHPTVKALEIVRDIITKKGAGALVFDSTTELFMDPNGAGALSVMLRRMVAALARSNCALIFLTLLGCGETASNPGKSPLPQHAALQLLIQRRGWIWKGHDIRGYEARVAVLKNKFAPAGQEVPIAITFNGAAHGGGM